MAACLFTASEVLELLLTQGSEDEDDGERCNDGREEEREEDKADLFEDAPVPADHRAWNPRRVELALELNSTVMTFPVAMNGTGTS
ncbi:hypothetical protein ElyMa_001004700 [Elysia marginata]|uniref:Uncharacterized protein n=1 Tax=Elysia marginata TaxID=1093978 RepID=A0AAV4HJP7_9GAST|nr:hypothetical protein ElyMa_001004700 [Elysia marginata]